jgi:CheY-like chemotaxis protein
VISDQTIMPSLFLIQWSKEAARQRAAELREEGWTVAVESEDGGRAYKKIRQNPPDVIVIDLSEKPSHSREVALALHDVKASRDIPVVFIEGSDEAREATRARLPSAVFATPSTFLKIIGRHARQKEGGHPDGKRRDRRS